MNTNEDFWETGDTMLQSNTVVVYGLPNKDSNDHFSSNGYNNTTDNYKRFFWLLKNADRSKNRTIYILEPDAIGLFMDPDEVKKGPKYEKTLRTAIRMLSCRDLSSGIYIDIGFWCLGTMKAAEVTLYLQG